MNKEQAIELTARVRKHECPPQWLVPCEGCRHVRSVHVQRIDGSQYCWTGGETGWCDCPGYVDPPHLRDTPER